MHIRFLSVSDFLYLFTCGSSHSSLHTHHKMYKSVVFLVLLETLITICTGRIHNLDIQNDLRKYIALSTFGFYEGGVLDVKLENFRATPENTSALFGFSLDRTTNDAMNPYLNNHKDQCILEQINEGQTQTEDVTYFILDLKNKKLNVRCNHQQVIHVFNSKEDIPPSFLITPEHRRKRQNKEGGCGLSLDIKSALGDNGHTYYNASFALLFRSSAEEGLYSLYFHNCPNYHSDAEVAIDCRIKISEHNVSSYLSAGEMPLPALYCMMAVLFLLSGMFWVFLLKQSRHPVFKIHYLMAVLVFLKAASLAFHGVNYHYIERDGVHLATWAVLFYVAHLLKGALLFVVLILVGTGWTFIKHVLAPRDKRLFMIIIPLQVLANIAEIILEESEEGDREYFAWRNLFISVDLLCCGCILFPVVWSIRHLQEASETDGKAAINLRKLKLFRHFYMMIVCYIYTTRIIVFLLKMAVPFQYGWLDDMFKEMATYVFFVLTAYKFRPAAHNPYFALSDDDDDEEKVLTKSGITEGLSRVNSRTTKVSLNSTMTEVTEEEKDALLSQRESSHDYD